MPISVVSIGDYAFVWCEKLNSINLLGVEEIGSGAFFGCYRLRYAIVSDSLRIQDFYDNAECSFPPTCTLLTESLLRELARNNVLVDVLANNDAFVTAVANKIKGTVGTYGLATQSELGSLATKSELTSAITESKTAGVNSVLSNPNLWTLYTTSQIQNMAMGDLVLTKQVNGKFALNYDIEQSEDLKTWTTYRALYLPLNGLPTDKAFVRIKMINSSSNPSASTAAGSNMY
jgi:hypothetical protein